MNIFNHIVKLLLLLILLLSSLITKVYAGDAAIDKVYHPYVLPDETEIEWRFLAQNSDSSNALVQRLGYGFSLSENVTMEGYVVGNRDNSDNFGLESYELEVRWMMTEQGEFWADWGTLFTIEKKDALDDWSAKTGVLFEKEFGRTSLTMNFFVIQEWGNDAKKETETDFRLQYRYRWLPQLQPAIEFFSGSDYLGVGPSFMGLQRFADEKQLKWEMGFIFGLSNNSADQALRINIEYEY
jgi:hypothetical protein